MNLKFKEIVIPECDPFQNCKLGRRLYADILESIITTEYDGYVVALNGAWGTGKTTFVKMWEKQLKKNGYKTLYFNAWETDFVSDPLIALVGKLKSIYIPEKVKHTFVKVTTCAAKIATKTVSGLINAASNKYLGEEATGAIKGTLEGVSEMFQHEIENFEEECQGLKQFRVSLQNFVDSIVSKNKDGELMPLVFFVDELDRCNPHYAVKVLERIKHLFTIRRIIFVLSIDKEQLCNSIRGYYGSDRLNADEYLRRFIDVEYNLPAPKDEQYIQYLYDELRFNEYFSAIGDEGELNMFLNLTEALFLGSKLSLRQIQKLLVQTRLVLRTLKSNQRVNSIIVLLTLYLRMYHQDEYLALLNRRYDCQGLLSILEKTLPFKTLREWRNKGNLTQALSTAVASLLVVYATKPFGVNGNPFIAEENNQKKLLLQPNEIETSKLQYLLEELWYGACTVLDSLISHIELLMQLEGK